MKRRNFVQACLALMGAAIFPKRLVLAGPQSLPVVEEMRAEETFCCREDGDYVVTRVGEARFKTPLKACDWSSLEAVFKDKISFHVLPRCKLISRELRLSSDGTRLAFKQVQQAGKFR